MLGPNRCRQIAFGLATTVTLLTTFSSRAWTQGSTSVGPTNPPPPASGNAASTLLIFLFLAAVIAAIVVAARYVTTRRKRLEEALILQARLYDAILREAPLRDVAVTPKARVAVWRGSPVTIEVAGEVPTPELRDTVLRLVRTELSRVRPDVLAEDHLCIVPPMRRAS